MPFVISKCACNNSFPVWEKVVRDNDVTLIQKRNIIILGGQGVMDRRSFVTPRNGVITEVTEEEAELLKNNVGFMKMVKRGFMEITGSEKSAGKESDNMEVEDDSSQLTPVDFAEDAQKAERDDTELRIGNRKIDTANAKPSRKRRKC